MQKFLINHAHNEASGLLGIQHPGFLDHRGWESGFWIVSDELPASRALAALGQKRSGEWEVVPVKTRRGRPSTHKNCEDCETIARAGSHVYIFGSQYGTKKGPLQPKRHFIARFNEALLDVEEPAVDLDLVRRPFAIHRLVNDALRGLELLPMDEKLRKHFIRKARKEGRKWLPLLQDDDTPVNVEGSAFVEGGRLLLGLRYPVTRDGHPIIIELEGIDRLFARHTAPPIVMAVHVLEGAGSARRPSGIRELDSRGGWVHAITGDLDEDLLDGREPAPSEHWVFRWEYGNSGVQSPEARCIHVFEESRVEGIALDADRAWYVRDDEQICLERHEMEGV